MCKFNILALDDHTAYLWMAIIVVTGAVVTSLVVAIIGAIKGTAAGNSVGKVDTKVDTNNVTLKDRLDKHFTMIQDMGKQVMGLATLINPGGLANPLSPESLLINTVLGKAAARQQQPTPGQSPSTATIETATSTTTVEAPATVTVNPPHQA